MIETMKEMLKEQDVHKHEETEKENAFIAAVYMDFQKAYAGNR